MRKLKLQVQMTLDGFISGANGEMDWMTFNWTDDLKAYVIQITNPVDTILLGRKLAEGFIPHWTEALKHAEEGAQKMVETPKIVFSKTLFKSKWERTTMANGELTDEINALKKQAGGDMIVYGGGKFVSSLIKEKLIDELHLFINPAVIGKGMPIFQEVADKQNYKLRSSKQFECGIAVLTYNPI
ncbi:MAG TPA: dihydrofolate reductase family protein [Bacteroidia bacterium]|nr:dihydrofolate reductase family protein [Bacteroidia bacterium]